ncbi:MAG: glutathione S-transferase family protein [Woeseiaceae bacterium]
MPQIEPANVGLKQLKGIHLWHSGLSSCSQRVRLTLNELGLDFESHVVNLHAGEHATAEYQQIHPNGVVPALVHDGNLWVESIDIIAYLDATLGNNRLRPGSDEKEIAVLLERADNAQSALKVCTFEFLFSGGPKLPDEKFQEFLQSHKSEHLVQFHRDARTGLDRDRVHEAVSQVNDDFLFLEDRLGDGRKWLAGNHFTIADIAWMPNLHRMDLLRWPLEKLPKLNAWFRRAAARDSYDTALEAWEPQGLFDIALPALDERRLKGDGISDYGSLSG